MTKKKGVGKKERSKRKSTVPKTAVVKAKTVAVIASDPAPHVSSRLQFMIDDVKADFVHFTAELGAFNQSRMAVAPKLMKAFRVYTQENPDATFVSFVRLLDPSVPEDRDGYRAHSSYQAAEYLRSLDRLASLETVDAPKTIPATPITALARVVAMILPTIKDEASFWYAFRTRLHWNESQVERLQNVVKKQRGLLTVTGSLTPAGQLKDKS